MLIDDKTWPPLPQGACIPFSFPKHLPEAFCFVNRRPLAQPWTSVNLDKPEKGYFSTVSVRDDSLVVSLPASPGIFQKWVAPGALVAGCGAVAWWLARSALMSAQPALFAAAVPFGAAGAVLGNMVHQEGSQVRHISFTLEYTFKLPTSRGSEPHSHLHSSHSCVCMSSAPCGTVCL